ncbi:chorismate--pyruvate lyase family protein [Hydrogenophaga sp. OTU3427]|uniref:chorismate--pyruvate lyase family protein n=1 Tax=Hydrogenophaga sp. OTU3427 TaxID=3043856 RepID=UPI00313C9023
MSHPTDWLAEPDLPRLDLPAPLHDWMRERGSLTQRLRAHWGDVAVLPLQEDTVVPLAHEARRLGLPDATPAWLRSIVLVCRGRPRVYARTVIPDWDPHNPWAEVQRLGRQPLGELLFRLPGLQRSPFEWQCGLDWPHASQWPDAMDPTAARRCVFVREQAPLLLTEVFLDPHTSP